MRIGIDFRTVSQHKGGMAVYANTLFNTLKLLDKKNEYVSLDDHLQLSWTGKHKLRWVLTEQYWLQVRLIQIFRKLKLDLGFFPNPPVPFFLGVPLVLTIPDMAFIYDTGIPVWVKAYLFAMYFFSAHKATVVITFSHNSKADIAKFLKLRPAKIIVAPLAAAKTISRRPETRVKATLAKLHVPQPYILAVPGTFLPRKNMPDLLKSFKDIDHKTKEKYYLVIVGIPSGPNYQQTIDLARVLNIASKVIFVGRLSDSDLSAVYSGASLFVCPSLYEGFGLPVLEAMKCEVPVIAYSNSSLIEVVGNAGILIHSSTDLPSAITRVLNNPSLQVSLKRKGKKHQQQYSWEKTAATITNHLPQNAD